MNRRELQKLSHLRQLEARALLHSRYWHGAYYLLGYSVECALKACIAKLTRIHDFPDKSFATSVHTHNLEMLAKHAGIFAALQNTFKIHRELEVNWTVVKDWSESDRYSITITDAEAKDFYSACTSRGNGILPWIRKHW